MTRVLVVEDEPRIAEFVERGLQKQGWSTTVASDGATGLAHALSGGFDLVVLDLGLPVMDGTQVLQAMRRNGCTTPVVVLTARGGVDDVVAGFDLGADDYLVKPFRFPELLARVRARLREPATPERYELSVGSVALDLLTRRASVDGRDVELTAREFALLELFLRNAGQVLSREQVLSHVWGYDYEPQTNVVEVYVGYLRRKLGARTIATVRGMGYRFVG